MLWKHMPLGDHLAFEQLLIPANLHSLDFFSLLVNLKTFGFGISETSIF